MNNVERHLLHERNADRGELYLLLFICAAASVVLGLAYVRVFPAPVFWGAGIMCWIAIVAYSTEINARRRNISALYEYCEDRVRLREESMANFRAGIEAYIAGHSTPSGCYDGWHFIRRLLEQSESHRSEAYLQRCIDNGSFPTREMYLEYCRREADKYRRKYKPIVRFVRGPDLDWLHGNPPNQRKGPPCGIVVIRQIATGHPHAGAWEVGASFCNPKERHKFDRAEAFMKAVNRTAYVPLGFDPEAPIEDSDFYENFPKSCRPMIQTMLVDLTNPVRNRSVTVARSNK